MKKTFIIILGILTTILVSALLVPNFTNRANNKELKKILQALEENHSNVFAQVYQTSKGVIYQNIADDLVVLTYRENDMNHHYVMRNGYQQVVQLNDNFERIKTDSTDNIINFIVQTEVLSSKITSLKDCREVIKEIFKSVAKKTIKYSDTINTSFSTNFKYKKLGSKLSYFNNLIQELDLENLIKDQNTVVSLRITKQKTSEVLIDELTLLVNNDKQQTILEFAHQDSLKLKLDLVKIKKQMEDLK